MWRKAGPVRYPSDTVAHPYTPASEPSHFLVFAWRNPTLVQEINIFRARRDSLGFPVEHVVMGLGELEYQIFVSQRTTVFRGVLTSLLSGGIWVRNSTWHKRP